MEQINSNLEQAIMEFDSHFRNMDENGVTVYQRVVNKLLVVLVQKYNLESKHGVRATDWLWNEWQNWSVSNIDDSVMVI